VVPAKITTTLYSGGAVYENDVMQFIGHEEGRIRFTPVQGAVPAKFDFDYMLKDHLGNVRMVLTDEIKSDAYPTLSFEGTSGTTEVINQDASWENANGLSINVVGVRIGRPSAMGTSSTNGSYVRSIKKSTGAIGATKLLKVMAGDRIHTSVDYFYIATNASNGTANPLNSFVTSLISSFSASTQISGQIKNEVSTITSQLSVNSAFTSAINPAPNTSGSNQAPKAYLNVLFFDDQFKFDATSSVVVKVAYSPNVKQTIDRKFSNALTAGKSGYVYIYFSNESESPVHFDNFMLTHERSSLIEETHYYPFGLTMAGISSKALAFGNPKNKKGYNGNELQSGEFSDGSGLEFYDFNARSYDQQIGRFMQIDPLSDTVDQSSLGPFQFSYNNPVRYGDPSGKCPCLIPALVWLGKAAVAAYVAYKATEAAKPLIDEVVRSVEDKLPEIKIDPENKVDRDLLNPPSKPGNAPTYKEDGKSIEIHHDGQNPEGPFKEMHPEEHRGKGNFKKNHSNTGQEPSKIDRKEWNKKVREYWQKEYDKRKLIEGTPEIT
jgi:RHS repeat-associated protein